MAKAAPALAATNENAPRGGAFGKPGSPARRGPLAGYSGAAVEVEASMPAGACPAYMVSGSSPSWPGMSIFSQAW